MNDSSSHSRQLVDLLLIDQHQRWHRGERVLVESYLQQHPDLSGRDEEMLDLLYNEIFLRTQRGETPQVDEYQRRFPHLTEPLSLQFAVHHALSPAELLPPAKKRVSQTRVGWPAIPGYEILDEIGRGSTGVIYRARQKALDREVALKMIRSERRPVPQQMARFRAEAAAIARLQHPNIVQVFEVGEHEGWPWFALELVEGGTLAQRLAGQPLPPRDAAALMEPLARAVAFAHERGVVHRDLKPANVLLAPVVSGQWSVVKDDKSSVADNWQLATGNWQPKVTDFGLAKRLDRDSRLTRLGDILGTPQYMAAEQARGRPEEVGPAADIFGLGAILYELLTGRPPVQADTVAAAVLEAQSAPPVPPRRRNPQVPRDLEAVCLKCLEKEPAERYASAAALADDLRRYLAGDEVAARPLGPVPRALRWLHRHPAGAALIGFIALFLALLGAAETWYTVRLQSERDRAIQEGRTAVAQRDVIQAAKGEVEVQRDAARQAQAEAEAQRDTAARARAAAEAARAVAQQRWQEARRSLYALQLAQVAALWSTEPERGRELLENAETCPEELRDFTWKLFHRACSRAHTELHGHQDAVLAVAYQPRGNLLASAGADHSVRLWDLATGKSRVLEGHKDQVLSLAFNPDGKWLASAGADHTVLVWDLARGTVQWNLADIKTPVQSVAFNTDGSVLALGCHDGHIRLWHAGKGAQTVKLSEPPTGKKGRAHALHHGPVHVVAFSPDGQTFASGGADGTVKLWNVKTGQPHGTLTGHRGPVRVLSYSPDGKTLASGGDDGAVRLWDPAKTAVRIHLLGHVGAVHALAFTPDGRTLASGSAQEAPKRRATVAEVKLWDPATGQLRVSFPHPAGDVHSLAFGESGRQLALGGQGKAVELWDAWLTLEGASLRSPTGVQALALAPDGRTLATAGRERAIHLWDPATGLLRSTLEGHTGEVRALLFTADGRTLISGSTDARVKLWDSATGQLRSTLPAGDADPVAAVASHGNLLAAAGTSGTIYLWKMDDGAQQPSLQGHEGAVTALAFAPDGKTLASAGRDGTVRLWDPAAGKARQTLAGHTGPVLTVAFAPDGLTLASGGADGTLKLWDLAIGKERHTLRGHRGVVLSATFTPDGRALAAGSAPDEEGRVQAPGEVRLWDPVTGQVRATLRGHSEGVAALGFTPDNALLATASLDGVVKLWRAAEP